MARARRVALALAAALLGAAALMAAVGSVGAKPPPERSGSAPGARPADQDPELVAEGRELFEEGCSSCHGLDARGIEGTGPDLRGAGAASADFYLSTGRMPLDKPGDQPISSQPRYSPDEIEALVAYVGSLGGPPVPEVHPDQGELNEGLEAFTFHCAGCHQIVAKGGVVTGAFAPSLNDATPTQVAEAVRVGPYLMPDFPHEQIDDSTLDSIARYVDLTQHPVDEGGWGIGNIGPVPEGMVAWLLAIIAMLLVARLIGERAR
jgi:ubiquinol-cytochrome c reductase cytochrome c subunit